MHQTPIVDLKPTTSITTLLNNLLNRNTSIRVATKPSKGVSLILKLVVTFLLLDFLYVILGVIFDFSGYFTQYQMTQFYLFTGDIIYLVFGDKCPLIARMINVFYRVQALLFLGHYFTDKNHWLAKADEQLEKLKLSGAGICIDEKCLKMARTIRLATLIQFIFFFISSCLIMLSLAILKSDRYSLGSLISGLLYFALFVAINSWYTLTFTSQYYLLSSLATHFLKQFNRQLKGIANDCHLVDSSNLHDQLLQTYAIFSQLYILIWHLNWQLKRVYVIVVVSGFCTATHFFYMAFYTQLGLPTKTYFFSITLHSFAIIIVASFQAGKINDTAKKLSALVYYRIVIEHRCNLQKSKRIFLEVSNSKTVLG